jgi:hypothetical protein
MLARVVFFLAAVWLGGCKKAPPPPLPKPAVAAKPVAAAPVTTNDTSQFVSVFEDLPPQVGKDPFFPTSHRRDPSAATAAQTHEHVDQSLVLKGIVGSVGRRIAVINDETMEVGEQASVRTPGGHVRVKCLDIGVDYALIQVEGEPQSKKLVMEQKR